MIYGYNVKESLNGIWLNAINNKMIIENNNIIISKLIIIIESYDNWFWNIKELMIIFYSC